MQRKVFICGAGPLPNEKGLLWQTAYGVRTWQFLHAFKEKEWEIHLILLTEDKHYQHSPKLNIWEKLKFSSQDLHVLHLDKDERGFEKRLKQAFQEINPEICIGINNLPSYFLAKLNPQIPFWADLNGWQMAEAQSASHVHKDSSYLPTLWEREKKILETMDCASTASSRQKDASCGELASTFRMNQFAEGWDFFHTIPPANELETDKASNYELPVPKEAESVLFCGSYNTWLDEKTLFEGVDLVMSQNPVLHFLSTGKKEEAESNPVLKRFLERIEASSHKDRFHFLGWLDKADLLAVYEQVIGAINLDRDNLETYFGARNRINEWLHYGVPTMSTAGSEFTHDLSEAGVIFTIPFESPKELSRVLSEELSKLDRKAWSKKAKEFVAKNYSYAKTLEPLKEWLKNPKRAPDKTQKVSMVFFAKLRFRIKKDGMLFLFKWCLKKLR